MVSDYNVIFEFQLTKEQGYSVAAGNRKTFMDFTSGKYNL